MANTVADRSPSEDKAACLGDQRFGRTEKPICVDAESLMNAEAMLLDVIKDLPEGPWRTRFSQIYQSIRDSIARYERSRIVA
jgi:hypothetical protein